jgi:hypothetical protein
MHKKNPISKHGKEKKKNRIALVSSVVKSTGNKKKRPKTR